MTKQASRQVGADFEREMGEGEGEWGVGREGATKKHNKYFSRTFRSLVSQNEHVMRYI